MELTSSKFTKTAKSVIKSIDVHFRAEIEGGKPTSMSANARTENFIITVTKVPETKEMNVNINRIKSLTPEMLALADAIVKEIPNFEKLL